jgi:hypothetical protein
MSMSTTPAERFEHMKAMPTQVLYMTRGGSRALITQSLCKIISQTEDELTFETVLGLRTISMADVFAIKEGRLSEAEIDAVFKKHGHEQRSF